MIWPGAWLLGALLVGFAGTNRRMGFWGAFGLGLLLTPLIAIIIVIGSAHAKRRGCAHCGNAENEAEYCNLCGRNAAGDQRATTTR